MNNDNTLYEFNSFLKLHKTYNSKNATHVLKSKGGCMYTFNGKDYHDFLKKYSDLLTESPGEELNFAEITNKDNASLLIVKIKFV